MFKSIGRAIGGVFRGIGRAVSGLLGELFGAPKVTLPTIEMPEPPEMPEAPRVTPELPRLMAPKKRSDPRRDISVFRGGSAPTLSSLLGLGVAPVSPGLMIPGGDS